MRTATLLAMTAAAVLAAAVPAQADSLVFVSDHDVWLSNTDGSGLNRVTTDGTAENPYQSPSQTDDGRIVTMRAKPNGAPLYLLRQNGEELGRIPVGALQAGPMYPHVAPDGRHVAFGVVYGGYVNGYYEIQTSVRAVALDGTEVAQGGANATTPSWLDSGTVLTGAGPVAKLAALSGGLTSWWSDYDHYTDFGRGEDLRDAEAAAGRVVLVRGEGDGKTMHVYRAGAGTAGTPTPTCVFSDPAPGPLGSRFVDPTLSPDGTQMAWQEGNGVWTVSQPDPSNCAIEPRLLIAGASEPDWSPAANAPTPRSGGGTGTGTGGGQTGGGQSGGGQSGGGQPKPAGGTVKVTSRSRRGVAVRVTAAKAGRATAKLTAGGRSVAKRSATVNAGRAVTLRLKPSRGLRAGARATVVVTLPGEAARTLRIRVR